MLNMVAASEAYAQAWDGAIPTAENVQRDVAIVADAYNAYMNETATEEDFTGMVYVAATYFAAEKFFEFLTWLHVGGWTPDLDTRIDCLLNYYVDYAPFIFTWPTD
jgi:hypothetical protein